MKKILIFLNLLILCILLNSWDSIASSVTASAKGFNTKGLSYVNDISETTRELSGEKLKYGNIDAWTAIYKQQVGTSMFYYVLIETKISSNINSLNNGYYRMVNDYMEVYAEGSLLGRENQNDLQLVHYLPSPDYYGVNSSTETQSLSLGLGVDSTKHLSISQSFIGGDIGKEESISVGVNWSTSYSINNVSLLSNSTDRKVTSILKFTKQSDKKLNTSFPYRGDYFYRTVLLFELSNYATYQNQPIHFAIRYTGSIRKYACTIFGCNGYESISDHLNFDYKFNI